MTSDNASIAALAKGLTILQTLARFGENSAQGLAQITGIPRPTVHRVLLTLKHSGFVVQSQRGEGYRLTELVKTLADGYKDNDWLLNTADSLLSRLRRKVAWPTDIAICNGGWMVITASTHDQNPLSLDRVVRGRRVAMVTSSLGKTYLAFCPEIEREALLRTIKPITALEKEVLASMELFRRELDETRARGYGIRVRGVQPKTGSIAVPVMHEGWVLACVNIHWIARAMTVDEAVERYLGSLQTTARRLETSYANYLRQR